MTRPGSLLGSPVRRRFRSHRPGIVLQKLVDGLLAFSGGVPCVHARRYRALNGEISELDTNIARLCAQANPALLAAPGVGPDVAATLLIAAGDNPERLTNEASFAALCGATPIEASSGRTVRHRLNRGGDRHANNALWRIAMARLRHDERTKAYAARRTAQGKSRREIIRCLKRHIAREIQRLRENVGFGSVGVGWVHHVTRSARAAKLWGLVKPWAVRRRTWRRLLVPSMRPLLGRPAVCQARMRGMAASSVLTIL